MSWLLFSLIAYFINAVNAVIDKILLKTSIPHPSVYAFYVGLLSILSLVLIPFSPLDISFPELNHLILNLVVGGIFILALITFFHALKNDEPGRVTAIMGGFTPIFIGVLSFFFLNEKLTNEELVAFAFLMSGGVLISIKRKAKTKILNTEYDIKKLYSSFLAAVMFGIFYVGTKYTFINQPFLETFIWTRMGSFLTALILLFLPQIRNSIWQTTSNLSFLSTGLFLVNKLLAGISFIILNYAISLGSTTLIQAAEGTKYIFILLITIPLSVKFPDIYEEKFGFWSTVQKITAILVISFGLILLNI